MKDARGVFRVRIQEEEIGCVTRGSNRTGEHGIVVRFGGTERHLQGLVYHYTHNPNVSTAAPSKSFFRCRRMQCGHTHTHNRDCYGDSTL